MYKSPMSVWWVEKRISHIGRGCLTSRTNSHRSLYAARTLECHINKSILFFGTCGDAREYSKSKMYQKVVLACECCFALALCCDVGGFCARLLDYQRRPHLVVREPAV